MWRSLSSPLRKLNNSGLFLFHVLKFLSGGWAREKQQTDSDDALFVFAYRHAYGSIDIRVDVTTRTVP